MDHHTVAAVSIAGTSLDVLGSLYLAYDLLAVLRGFSSRTLRLQDFAIFVSAFKNKSF